MKLEEIQQQALALDESARASLAVELLDSLPPVLMDSDEGIEEARKRLEELDSDPAAGRSWQEIRNALGR